MEDFSSTGQLVTLGLVDSSIGAMAEGLALVDVETLVAKNVLLSLNHCLPQSGVADPRPRKDANVGDKNLINCQPL